MNSTSSGSPTQPPSAFLIPVRTLTVPAPWTVGRATIHPASSGADLIRHAPPFESRNGFVAAGVQEVLDSAAGGSIAEVSGAHDIEQAIDELRASLSVLRLFQASRRSWTETTFGLGGDTRTDTITYISVWDRSAFGGKVEGHFTGYAFDRAGLDAWNQSVEFQYLSSALIARPDEGAERAVRGALLFDRAALERSPDLRMFGFAAALEAWIHGDERGPKKFRLARHVAWFGCGAHDGDLCGRARPICPYLHLQPRSKRLHTLRELGNSHSGWRCSEWHRVVDWYDARSAVAHGGLNLVTEKEAQQPEFWISHYLVKPILLWLRDHPDDPVGDLQRALNSQSDPAGWSAMCEALDAPQPPTRPPGV